MQSRCKEVKRGEGEMEKGERERERGAFVVIITSSSFLFLTRRTAETRVHQSRVAQFYPVLDGVYRTTIPNRSPANVLDKISAALLIFFSFFPHLTVLIITYDGVFIIYV